MKEYTHALIYNNPKLKDEWMEAQKERCDSWKYDMKSQKLTLTYEINTLVDNEVKRDVWYMIKAQPSDNWTERYRGCEFYSIRFLDGEFRASDIMTLLSKVRGGVRDV